MSEPDTRKAQDLLADGAEKLKDASAALAALAEWLEQVARELKR